MQDSTAAHTHTVPPGAGAHPETFVARLDRLLRVASSASDAGALEGASRRLSATGRQMAEELALLALELQNAGSRAERSVIVQRIRLLVGA